MLDAYARRARLAPAALAAVPALVLVGVAIPNLSEFTSIAATALGAIGLVVCGVVRSAGLRIQPHLWEIWGGPPTTQMLRWRENDLATVERHHRQLEAATGEELPNAAEEAANPAAADRRYGDAVEILRERTRDASKHPTVAAENAEYGFRRNCLGIRPFAITLAAIVGVAGCAIFFADGSSLFLAPLFVGVLAAIGWLRLVTVSWVRSAADLYAARLIEASAAVDV